MKYENSRVLGIFGFLIVIALWYIVSLLKIFPEFLIPMPHQVFVTVITLLMDGKIIFDIGSTLYRTVIAYAIAALIGVPIGIMLGYSQRFYLVFQPAVDFFRSIPATALFPLFLLFFGFGDPSKISIAVFAASLIIMINSMYGVHNVNKSRILLAKTMKASQIQIFNKVVFFDALPYVFVGLRQSLSIVLIIVIVTEMFFGSNNGLGYQIFNYQTLYEVEKMYAAIIMTGILGYILNVIFVRFEKRLVHWAGK